MAGTLKVFRSTLPHQYTQHQIIRTKGNLPLLSTAVPFFRCFWTRRSPKTVILPVFADRRSKKSRKTDTAPGGILGVLETKLPGAARGVCIYQLSDRKGEAGMPKLLNRVATDQFFIPYLTAIGAGTSGLVTLMDFRSFSTVAVAG